MSAADWQHFRNLTPIETTEVEASEVLRLPHLCEDIWTDLASDPNAQKKNQRIVLTTDAQGLYLSKQSRSLSREEQEENRRTVRAYREFLIHEYGTRKINQVVITYQPELKTVLDLGELERLGEPLTSEHIYYYNMGLHDFEMSDVHEFIQCAKKQSLLGRHEKGLNRAFSSWNERQQFLDRCKKLNDSPLVDMDLPTFQTLMTILMPPTDQDHLYTGRKIEGCIQGSYTGTRFCISYQPWLDQQELLQLFNELKNSPDGDAFYELLSKSVVKKSLMKTEAGYENYTWRVGELIPGPNNVWYRIEQGIDAQAKFFYLLVPAHPDYPKETPVILLYRSTASDPYAQGGGASVQSDLNPRKLPGVDARKYAWEYEATFLQPFTAPMWLIYYQKGLHAQTEKAQLEFFQKAASLLSIVPHDLSKEILQKKLEKHAALYPEEWDPEKREFIGKSDRPLAILGDSLGGSFAQNAITTHLSAVDRAPLVPITCFAHSAPLIKKEGTYGTEQFFSFVKEHGAHFPGSIQVEHLWEQGDPVPKQIVYVKEGQEISEGAHLGHGLPSKGAGYQIRARFFTPLANSTVPEIRDQLPHERRYLHGKGQLGIDYEVQEVTVSDFDNTQESPALAKLRNNVIYGLFSTALSLKRSIVGRRNVPRGLENQGIVVSYDCDKDQHSTKIIPIQDK